MAETWRSHRFTSNKDRFCKWHRTEGYWRHVTSFVQFYLSSWNWTYCTWHKDSKWSKNQKGTHVSKKQYLAWTSNQLCRNNLVNSSAIVPNKAVFFFRKNRRHCRYLSFSKQIILGDAEMQPTGGQRKPNRVWCCSICSHALNSADWMNNLYKRLQMCHQHITEICKNTRSG